jgi:oligosaccharide repeat unit polymerase
MRIFIYTGCLTIILGVAYFAGIETEPFFLPLSLFTIIGITIVNLFSYRDWINPLIIITGSALFRIGLPGLIYYLQPSIPDEFWIVWLPIQYWHLGWNLALIGLTSIVLGWTLTPQMLIKRTKTWTNSMVRILPNYNENIAIVALLYLIIGISCLVIFFRSNYGSSLDVLYSGSLRSQEMRVDGTSRYNFLATWLMTSGAVILSAYLAKSIKNRRWFCLIPGLFIFFILTPFGGRIGAMTPLIYGLIILWYQSNKRQIRIFRDSFLITCAFLIANIYSAFVFNYRKGGGLDNAIQALSWDSLSKYFITSFWTESGTLHPFAYATFLGSGVLRGATYPEVFGFFPSIMFGIETVRPGAFIVQQLISPSATWGLHTGIIIDLFLNSGLSMVIIGSLLFGSILRCAYEGFLSQCNSIFATIIYVIFFWQSIWIFYESIIVIFPIILSFFFVTVLFVIAKFLPTSQKFTNKMKWDQYELQRNTLKIVADN